MEAAIIGAMVGSTVMSASASYNQGKQAEANAKFNQQMYDRDAAMAEQEAQTVLEKANHQKNNFRRQIKTLQSDVVHGYAFRGVEISEGSPMEVLAQNYRLAKDDEYIIQYNADVEAAALRNRADTDRFRGQAEVQMAKYTKFGKKMEAAGTLLSGGAEAGQFAMLT